MKTGSEKVNQCLDYCNLQRLTNHEIHFLDEYCQVMEPLAKALDILQSDGDVYGILITCLKQLTRKIGKYDKLDGLSINFVQHLTKKN